MASVVSASKGTDLNAESRDVGALSNTYMCGIFYTLKNNADISVLRDLKPRESSILLILRPVRIWPGGILSVNHVFLFSSKTQYQSIEDIAFTSSIITALFLLLSMAGMQSVILPR